MKTDSFDLILLDLTLPGRDGLEILASAQQRGWRRQSSC
jgi:CheY-like chemotaxis protein